MTPQINPDNLIQVDSDQALGSFDNVTAGIEDIKERLFTDRLIKPFFTVSVRIPEDNPQTAGWYGSFFIAPFACEVIEAWESHFVAASGPSATLTVEKLTSGQTRDGGVSVLDGTWDLEGTINDPIRLKASTNKISRTLSPGDRLSLDDTGTLNNAENVLVTVLLRPLNYSLSKADNPT